MTHDFLCHIIHAITSLKNYIKKMKKQKNYIFFDEIVTEYFNHHGECGESELVQDLRKYLADLSKNSQIIVITQQEPYKVTNWFIKHDLYQFTHIITNTMI